MLRTLPTRFQTLTHRIIERRTQGNHILEVRILGNLVSLETIVLRTRPTRFQTLTPHILQHLIQGNPISGDRIIGNRVYLETIVLRTRPTRVYILNTAFYNAVSKATVSLETVS